MNRKLVVNESSFFLIYLVVLNLAWFNVVQAATPKQAADLVKTTTDRMLQTLQQRRSEIDTNLDVIYEIANKIAVPHFDFERITKHAMGRFWQQANTAQRLELISAFKTLLVRTYAKALLNYADREVRLLPLRPSKRSDQVQVNTLVDMPSGAKIPINYLLYLKNAQWKSYDVVINGVSLVANYRNSFAQEIRNGGISGLIQTLNNRNREAAK